MSEHVAEGSIDSTLFFPLCIEIWDLTICEDMCVCGSRGFRGEERVQLIKITPLTGPGIDLSACAHNTQKHAHSTRPQDVRKIFHCHTEYQAGTFIQLR